MTRKSSDWVYLPGYTRTFALPDPRVAVSRHLNWDKTYISNYPNNTVWSTPEPDNYNFAVWHRRKHFLPDVEHQCWYRDKLGGGWMSLYVIPIEQQQLFVNYFTENPVWATWRCLRPIQMRQRISNIDLTLNKSWGKCPPRTEDERYYDMGFYDSLIARGVRADYVFKFAGVSRPQPEPDVELEPEEEDK